MELIERVWEYSQNNPQGFTISLETMQAPTVGYCVAYEETQDSHDRDSLERVINHAKAHDNYVGGWLNEENGRYYFDSIKIFDLLDDAKSFAKANQQIAIFDLNQQITIIIE